MNYIDAVRAYISKCEQEEKDKDYMLRFIKNNPNCLLRIMIPPILQLLHGLSAPTEKGC